MVDIRVYQFPDLVLMPPHCIRYKCVDAFERIEHIRQGTTTNLTPNT
jgi:hypothetical protein